MRPGYSRRRFLQGLAGAPLVVGWNTRTQSWVVEAAACVFAELPPLDGDLVTDTGRRAQFADDFGNLITRQPCAMLRPGSIGDIAEIVCFARRHRLKVSMNGQSGSSDLPESHSNFGQAQLEGGVAIDAKALSSIHDITGDGAIVDAGVLWAQLFDEAASHDLTPPVLTDYMHLSVGGP